MRIGIDARFYHKGSAGLARYTQELISHLAATKTSHTFVLFLREDAMDEFNVHRPNIEVRVTKTPHYSLREQLGFGRELRRAKLDLMHFTNFNFPLTYRAPFVITIHDLTLLEYAGRSRSSKLKTKPMRAVMQAGATHSREILTISEFQKGLIVREFGVPEAKVKVIHEAVDAHFTKLPEPEIMQFRQAKGLAKPMVMYTGQWRQHKNLVRLLHAFATVRQKVDAQLVLVGKVDPSYPAIPRTIAELGLQEHVTLTDFVENDDLPRYYNAARVFAFPSLTEGFGLPPLEAMACGTAVAASKAAPMPEILQDAAAYFDPRDTAQMAEVLIELLTNAPRREALVAQGFQQVKQYDWSRTAAETLRSYERAAGLDAP